MAVDAREDATFITSNTLSFLFSPFRAGDGGNDVSMIQAADCGIGIEGKVNPQQGVEQWLQSLNVLQG